MGGRITERRRKNLSVINERCWRRLYGERMKWREIVQRAKTRTWVVLPGEEEEEDDICIYKTESCII